MGRARVVASAAVIAMVGALAAVVVAPAAGATDVSTESQLRNAWLADGQIDLLNDITLTDCDPGFLVRSTDDPLSVDGHGFAIIQTCPDNIIDNSASDYLLQNITLRGGREPDDGGAIDMNGGSLTIVNSTLTDNCAADSAGAIENEDGDTSIIASTLHDNFAEDQGGAIRSKRGTTFLMNSTVTQNRQAVMGAIDSGQVDQVDALLILIYDTIVDNTNVNGLECPTAVPVEAETDVDDDADVGPLQFNPANVNAVDGFNVFGTVIALPNNGPNCDFPNTNSAGFNFADDDGLDNSCGFDAEGDIANGGDPLLGPLADNSGPTLTRLPANGSPLLEQIPLEACPGPDDATDVDQRGLPRPGFELCDIGSVEVQPEPPAPVPSPLVIEPTFTG